MAVRTMNQVRGSQASGLGQILGGISATLGQFGGRVWVAYHFYRAALTYYFAILPLIATAITIGTYVIFYGGMSNSAPAGEPMLVGLLVGVLAWLLAAALCQPKFDAAQANPTMHGALQVRLCQLQAQETILCPGGIPVGPTNGLCPTTMTAARTASYNIQEIESLLNDSDNQLEENGLLWLSGVGYNRVYKYLYYADEALMELEPIAEVCGEARRLQLVMKDSNIGNQSKLDDQLDEAIKTLEGIACPKGSYPANTSNIETYARGKIRGVSRIVHDYQSLHYDGLIRARDRLTQSVVAMGVGVYLLLALAMIFGATGASILTAAVYFLVGTAVGFFNRLRLDGKTKIVAEDYGWSVTQMLYTLLFSGLAALGGVLVVAMIPDLGSGLQAIALPPKPIPPSLSQIFDLDIDAMGLLVAAIFGLTPTLFTNALQGQVATITDDLVSLRPHNDTTGSKSGAKS